MLEQSIQELESGSQRRIQSASSLEELEAVRVEVLGKDAVGKPVRLRLCPYFHQGWDHKAPETRTDNRIPDHNTVGQERNVFARAGETEFAFSESNEALRTETVTALPNGSVSVFNRNPGKPDGSFDDNPAFNRGFTLRVNHPQAGVEFVDPPGPNISVIVLLDFGNYKEGADYEFSFRYWHGTNEATN